MGKYVIHPTPAGRTFHLVAGNGEIIGVSESYKSNASCKKGICSVQVNAGKAPIEDQTAPDFVKLRCPKFQVYVDAAGHPRFRLLATNGQEILASEAYNSKEACLNGIQSVKNNAPTETIE